MDLRLLHRFIVVAETGSINKAASRLHFSQPALTKSIRLLEERLGVPLIVRGPRGISLTPVGQTVLKHARLLLAEARKLDGEISAFKNISMGHVRIGVPPGPGFLSTVMPVAIRQFTRNDLYVTLDISMGIRADLLRPLLRGELDFIIASSGEEDLSSELVQEELYLERRTIVVAADHPLAGKGRVTCEELERHPWVVLKQGHFVPESVLDQAVHGTLSHNTINSNSTQFVKIVVLEDHYVGLVTHDAVRLEIQRGEFVELKVQGEEMRRALKSSMMELTYRRDVPLSSASARLMRAIKAACAEQYPPVAAPRAPAVPAAPSRADGYLDPL